MKFFLSVFVLIFCSLLPFQGNSQSHYSGAGQYSGTTTALRLAEEKMNKTLSELSYNSGLYPSHTDPETGNWVTSGSYEWTSGFFPGSLWLMYKLTGDETWKTNAAEWTKQLEPMVYHTADHDAGFRIFTSYGNAFQLTEERYYHKKILQAAAALASRFDPDVGAIKSWEPWDELKADFPIIIDNLINLELLFWAAKNEGRPVWHEIAFKHASTTLEHHMREDGSSYHIVDFKKNGQVNKKFTTQGYGPESVWARGQAWAIYGFTMAYRYTQHKEFLEAAMDAATYFIDHLPEDQIPWYDFKEPAIPNTSKDASAAAIAASGLLELFSYTGEDVFFSAAANILNILSFTPYSSAGMKDSSILRLSTLHRGHGGHGTSYADYYFLEALTRYQQYTTFKFPEITHQPDFYLEQNYPNPFNHQTRIFYSIPKPGPVHINLFDITGKKIQTIFNGVRQPGNFWIDLNAHHLASGTYFYRMETNDRAETKTMTLIK